MREVTSLALNFQESPPDQPMFGALQRKHSLTSSLIVQRSSPVAIPASSTRESTPYGVAAHYFDIPPGTVPDSPAPLQKALEKDIKHIDVAVEPSPAHSQMEGCVEPLPTPLPTPLPGTNLGFDHHDLHASSSSSHGPGTLISKVPSEASDYFAVPTVAHCTRTETRPQWKFVDDEVLDKHAAAPSALSEVKTVDLDAKHLHWRDSLDAVQGPPSMEPKKPERVIDTKLAKNFRLDEREKESAGALSSPIDIEHVVFEGSFESNTADERSADNASGMRQAEARLNLQIQAQQARMSTAPHTPPHATDNTPSAPLPHHTWGTHGSLYDGTGYGNNASSIFTRPTTSSTVPDVPQEEMTSDDEYTATSLAHDSAAMARDHEALEEVIRAYAALEEKAASSATEDAWEDVVHDDRTRDGLVETMARYSLNA
jgi:hypothetical protein